jgi:hypothetical protein
MSSRDKAEQEHTNGTLEIPEGVVPKALENPVEKDLISGEVTKKVTHKAMTGPLIPHTPRPSDIKQGGVGDCFFLASISSILSKENGPEKIENMMRDDKEGNVIVRLYKDGEPHYISVKKSVRSDRFQSRKRAHGPLWVSILEKAYTAFALDNNYNKLNDGGDMLDAFGSLQGTQGYVEKPISHNAELNSALTKLMYFNKFRPDSMPAKEVKAQGILNENELETWKEICERTGCDDSFQKATSENTGIHVFRFEDFQRVMNNIEANSPSEKAVLEKIGKWVEEERVFPGKRGTGRYTQPQDDLYQQIDDALQNGSFVGASTHKIVGSKQKLSWGHSGEGESKGMIGEHAFSVVRCEKRNGCKGVVVRNPWGDTSNFLGNDAGRSYTQKMKNGQKVLSAKGSRKAEYWVELSDLTKRFDKVMFAEPRAEVQSNPMIQEHESMSSRTKTDVASQGVVAGKAVESDSGKADLNTSDPQSLAEQTTSEASFTIDSLPSFASSSPSPMSSLPSFAKNSSSSMSSVSSNEQAYDVTEQSVAYASCTS